MINIDHIDRAEAMRYLSCRDKSNSGVVAEYLDQCERLVLESLNPKYTYKYFPLDFCGEKPVLTDCTLSLEGKDIAAHLAGCRGVIILAATDGAGVDALIRRLQVENMAAAVIADALAGAAVEEILNKAEVEIKERYGNMYFTERYSPGYGDLPLNIQKTILNILDAQKRIGLCVGSGGLLTPIKSVTAFIGVSENPLRKERCRCDSCNMRETCRYRKEGKSCGL